VRFDFFCGAVKVASQTLFKKDLPEFRALLASLNIPELIRSSNLGLTMVATEQVECRAQTKLEEKERSAWS